MLPSHPAANTSNLDASGIVPIRADDRQSLSLRHTDRELSVGSVKESLRKDIEERGGQPQATQETEADKGKGKQKAIGVRTRSERSIELSPPRKTRQKITAPVTPERASPVSAICAQQRPGNASVSGLSEYSRCQCKFISNN